MIFCHRMRTGCCLLILLLVIYRVQAIDESSENDYDNEIEDDVDIIESAEEQEDSASMTNLDEVLSSLEKDKDEKEEEQESWESAMADREVLEVYNYELDRGLYARLTNLLQQMRSEYAITSPYGQKGTCGRFRSSKGTVHKCSTQRTMLGNIKACLLTCKPGYHLSKVIPHYELCGASTEWRWSYQLRGDARAPEICLRGNGTAKEPTACTTPNCMATAAYYMNKIDYSVNPCNNFFDYACGRWIKETRIPAGSRGKFLTYSVLRNRVKRNMAGLLEQPIKRTEIAAVKKTKTVYKSCTDTERIEDLDSQPLLDFLKGKLSWPVIEDNWSEDSFDLEATLAKLRGAYHNNILFTVKVGKSNGNHILQTWKGRMAIPAKYYFTPRYANRKQAYFDLMRDVAVMLGADYETAERDVNAVMKFETALSILKVVEPDYFSIKTITEMRRDVPGIDWLKLFKNMIWTKGIITSSTKVQVWNVPFLKALIKLVRRTDSRTVQNYMVWRIVKHRVNNLSRRFQLRYLQFRREIYGMRSLGARWRTCANYIIFSLKGASGKMFVDKYFSPAKKKAAETMFHNIRKGFIHLLNTEVNWMDNSTKSYAKEKALAIKPYIGYNPKYYENVTYLNEQLKHLWVKEADYFGNVLRILTEISQNEFKKLGTTYNTSARMDFKTRPTMVNAFYSPQHNAVILPAGEMQYPFYWGAKFPRMFQYGAIGTILGHEITHGFDNTGSKFDKYGRLNNWWTKQSLKQFHKRTGCMRDQYSKYYWPTARENLNGQKTLGENIADNGGIRESYQGYQYWLATQNLTGEGIEPATGLTNNQMFFIGFANVRCAKYTRRAAEHTVATSVHSPGRFRVIGSLQNFDKFSKAFKCKLNSYMNPSKKCILW